MKAYTNKREFLRSEYNDWLWYWKEHGYKEYLKVMERDAIKCSTCKAYYWIYCKKRCNHPSNSPY